MTNSGNTASVRATNASLRGPLAAGLLALGALACSGGGEPADTALAIATDSTALAAPTTASTAAGTVAATGTGRAAAAMPASQPADGAAGVNRDTTPSRVAPGGAEQLKTPATTTPSEAKRLDAATRAVARQGATTRDTARTGAVTPPPPARKTAAPTAGTSSGSNAGRTTAAAAPSPAAAAPAPAATPAPAAAGATTATATAGTSAPASAQATGQATAQAGGDRLTASPAAYQGWKTFHVYCYRCHGTDAVGSDLAPNLRNSVSAQGSVTPATFLSIVRDGRLEKGMPAWKEMLTDEQIRNVYAYVKARSTGELAGGRPRQGKP